MLGEKLKKPNFQKNFFRGMGGGGGGGVGIDLWIFVGASSEFPDRYINQPRVVLYFDDESIKRALFIHNLMAYHQFLHFTEILAGCI